MRTQKLSRKLSLNKKTVANLDDRGMARVKGGVLPIAVEPVDPVDKETWSPSCITRCGLCAPTFPYWCQNETVVVAVPR